MEAWSSGSSQVLAWQLDSSGQVDFLLPAEIFVSVGKDLRQEADAHSLKPRFFALLHTVAFAQEAKMTLFAFGLPACICCGRQAQFLRVLCCMLLCVLGSSNYYHAVTVSQLFESWGQTWTFLRVMEMCSWASPHMWSRPWVFSESSASFHRTHRITACWLLSTRCVPDAFGRLGTGSQAWEPWRCEIGVEIQRWFQNGHTFMDVIYIYICVCVCVMSFYLYIYIYQYEPTHINLCQLLLLLHARLSTESNQSETQALL